eukprot:gene9443-biopygen2171
MSRDVPVADTMSRDMPVPPRLLPHTRTPPPAHLFYPLQRECLLDPLGASTATTIVCLAEPARYLGRLSRRPIFCNCAPTLQFAHLPHTIFWDALQYSVGPGRVRQQPVSVFASSVVHRLRCRRNSRTKRTLVGGAATAGLGRDRTGERD